MTLLVLARSRQSKRDGMAALYRSAATRATAGNHRLHELAATLNSAEATAYNSATGATLRPVTHQFVDRLMTFRGNLCLPRS